MFSEASPDVKKSEEYYHMAMENGSARTSEKLSVMYAIGEIFSQDPHRAIFYAAFAALMNENGELIADNRTANPLGRTLYLMKQGFINGDLHYNGERLIFTPCLTDAEYQEAVACARQMYERAKEASVAFMK
jgi:TPR repeat protein